MINRMTTEQRLTPEKLEAIRKRAEAGIPWGTPKELYVTAREDIPALLAEVERLRAALIEIADIEDWDYGLEIAKNITFKTIGEPKGWGGIDIE